MRIGHGGWRARRSRELAGREGNFPGGDPASFDLHQVWSLAATLGFNDAVNLDDGHLWPITFALTELTAVEEATTGAIVKKAVG